MKKVAFFDSDIKIAGDKPSVDVRKNKLKEAAGVNGNNGKVAAAKLVGKLVAQKFIDDAKNSLDQSFVDYDLLLQRRLLLSFTATVGFEQYITDETLCGFAQKSFLDTVKKSDGELYATSSDTGAFSFYYLAFRRGSDIERRMGQTFAMLCAHDGDPIFQELGEALYCWFLLVVKKSVEENIK